MDASKLIHFDGWISAITFSGGPDFSVAKFRPKDQAAEIVIAGDLASAKPKELITVHGLWTKYENKKGKEIDQFKVEAVTRPRPLTVEELQSYLVAAVQGVGPERARRMVKKFGVGLFQILEHQPERLIEVSGIGPSTAESIARSWRQEALQRDITAYVVSIGMTPKWGYRVLRDLGPNAIEVIKKNPYRLTDVHGVGFETADQIAQKIGWSTVSQERAEAVLCFLLAQSGNEGHCWLGRGALIQRALKHEIAKELAEQALDSLIRKEAVIRETIDTAAGPGELIYLKRLWAAESSLAERISRLMAAKVTCKYTEEQLFWIVEQSEAALDIELTDEQRRAVVNAFICPISILTGGPGTGKTACTKVLVDVAKRLKYSLCICAPTGRAAKNIADVSGQAAVTIHRLLKYNAEARDWTVNEFNPLATDMLIVEEASMIDVELAYRLFDAVPRGVPVLVIGDKDQLPAVSPGRVLEDMINSRLIPVTRLTKIFRQAAESLIITNAHRILRGETPSFPAMNREARMVDCYRLEPVQVLHPEGEKDKKTGRVKKIEDPDWIERILLKLCRERIPQRMNLDPIRDIQVLVPMKKKRCGVQELNVMLQEALNPKPDGPEGVGVGPDEVTISGKLREVEIGSKRFRVGDRVCVMRNNYGLDVFNGDIGFVTAIDNEEETISLDLYDRQVEFPYRDAAEDLELAYALTVHKSQGGEFPVVIVVLLNHHHIMLQRNLLYTAVTRAKKLLIFLSLDKNIHTAARNNVINERNSWLLGRLRQLMPKKEEVAKT